MKIKMQLLATTEELIKAYFQYDARNSELYSKNLKYTEILNENCNKSLDKSLSVSAKYLLNFKNKVPYIRAFLIFYKDKFSDKNIYRVIFTKNSIDFYETFDNKYKLLELINKNSFLEFDEINFSERD